MIVDHKNRNVSDIETMEIINRFPNGEPAMLYQNGVRVYFSDGKPQYAQVRSENYRVVTATRA